MFFYSYGGLLSQMTCIRLLEILPVVFEKLLPSFRKASGKSKMKMDNFIDYTWLNHLTNWGRSSLAVIVRYWKQALMSLLGLLKQSYRDDSLLANIGAIEKLIACGEFSCFEFFLYFHFLVSIITNCCFGLCYALQSRNCGNG